MREADRRAGSPQRDGDRRRERAEADREDQATQAAGTWCEVAIFYGALFPSISIMSIN